MENQNRPSFWSGFMSTNWSILITILSVFVGAIIICFGYLFLEDDIQKHLQKKELTPAQLEKLTQRAEQRISIAAEEANWDKVVDGIHLRTGFHADPNLQTIISACTSCHSSKLVTQNRATREGWETMIRWMQATQGLQDLGDSEPVILDYLAKYYAPKATGRRAQLDLANIEWYILELE